MEPTSYLAFAPAAKGKDAEKIRGSAVGNEEYRRLQDIVPFIIYRAGGPPEFRVLAISENVRRLTGFAPDRFTRDPDLWSSRIHPDDLERTIGSLENPHGEDTQSVEYRWKCADGKYRWFLDTFNIRYDERGKAVELVGCWFDISSRKSFEESMRQLSSIIESSDDAIIGATPDGTVTSWNASATRTYGYGADEMIGRPAAKLLPAPQRQEFAAALARISGGTPVGHREAVHRTRAGKLIIVSLTISPVRDVTNKVTGVSMIARDISDQKRLERELASVTQQYTEDLRHLTHSIQQAQEDERRRVSRELHDDLNQRLSNLKLSIEMLAGGPSGNAPGLIGDLHRLANQVDVMIRDVRKIAANLRPVVLDDFGLVVSLQLLCRDFQNLHGRTTTLRTGSALPASFNPDVQITLYRIAQEALSNVAKHSSATQVDVELTCDDSVLRMTIRDNGEGFDPTEVRSRQLLDRGLGLTGMKERIETAGGTLRMKTSAVSGTAIEAELPLALCARQP